MDEILSGGCELDVPWVPEVMNHKKYTKCFSVFLSFLFQCFQNASLIWFGLPCVDIRSCVCDLWRLLMQSGIRCDLWKLVERLTEYLCLLEVIFIIFVYQKVFFVWIYITLSHFSCWKSCWVSSRNLEQIDIIHVFESYCQIHFPHIYIVSLWL